MKTNLRIIVVGAGRLGLRTTRLLADRGHDVVMVDRDEDRCAAVAEEYLGTIIHGDASDPEILRQAEPEKADALAALTPDAERNLEVCRRALDSNDALRTVVRGDEESGEEDGKRDEEMEELVDEVIHPEHLGAIGAANALLGSSVRALENVAGTLQILAVEIAEDAPAAGKKLEEVTLPEGSLVVSDADADEVAHPEMTLEAGRTYVVAAEPGVVEELQQLLRG